MVVLISLSLARNQFTLPDQGHRQMHHPGCLPAYYPAYTGTCVYPQKDGQAELTWVADYRPMVYPSDILAVPLGH